MKKLMLLVSLIIIVLSMVGCEELPENRGTKVAPVGTGYPAAPGGAPAPVAGYPAGNPGGAADPYPVQGAAIQVMKPDNTAMTLSMDVLNQMAKVKITVDGKTVEGVKLLDILAKAGVSNFNKVIVAGSNGRMELTKSQVDAQTIIKTANGVQLLSPTLAKEKWILDINLLKIE